MVFKFLYISTWNNIQRGKEVATCNLHVQVFNSRFCPFFEPKCWPMKSTLSQVSTHIINPVMFWPMTFSSKLFYINHLTRHFHYSHSIHKLEKKKFIQRDMTSKSLGSSMVSLIFIFIILLSHPMHPQSDAATLTSRRTYLTLFYILTVQILPYKVMLLVICKTNNSFA